MTAPPPQADPDHGRQGRHRHRVDSRPRRQAKRPTGGTPFRLGQPRTVPITEVQHRQAVTALAAMIASWWHTHQQSPTNRDDTSTG